MTTSKLCERREKRKSQSTDEKEMLSELEWRGRGTTGGAAGGAAAVSRKNEEGEYGGTSSRREIG